MCSYTFRLWNVQVLSSHRLYEGAVIEYEIVANKGKESAENIKVK